MSLQNAGIQIRQAEDVARAIELLRISYKIAVNQKSRSQA